jgi:5-methylcytosine-specific restriction endonuclease McrA
MTISYKTYIQSDDWQKKRSVRLWLDGFRCRLCDSVEDLEVHHRPTSYPRIPHESIYDDLITLCRICHALVTERIRAQQFSVAQVPLLTAIEEIVAPRPVREHQPLPNLTFHHQERNL